MADHLSDEEQLEALKRWWKRYGAPIALALVLGVGSWFGWQQWQGARESRAQAASLVYEEMMSAIGNSAIEDLDGETQQTVATVAERLRDDYASTQYGRLARLLLARLAVAREDLEAAATELQAVIDDGGDAELTLLARLRLARVRAAQQRYEEALALVSGEIPDVMRAEFAEARGDIHLLGGDREAARIAYQEALDATPANGTSLLSTLLRIKLDQVRSTATAPDAVAPTIAEPAAEPSATEESATEESEKAS